MFATTKRNDPRTEIVANQIMPLRLELSLVDNPANQFANIVSIEKVDGKNIVSGYLSKAEI